MNYFANVWNLLKKGKYISMAQQQSPGIGSFPGFQESPACHLDFARCGLNRNPTVPSTTDTALHVQYSHLHQDSKKIRTCSLTSTISFLTLGTSLRNCKAATPATIVNAPAVHALPFT